MLCRRTLLQAGLAGLAVVTLDGCAPKKTASATESAAPATTSSGPPQTFGPRVPLGPAIPTDLQSPTPSAQRPAVSSQPVAQQHATSSAAPPPPQTVSAQTTVTTQPTVATSTRVITQSPPANAIAWSKDVPVGQSRLVQTQSGYILVTRTGASSIVGFSAVCTHQGCTVAGNFQCPCHGSMFNPRTGAVLQGPASLPLPSIGVAISGPYIVTT